METPKTQSEILADLQEQYSKNKNTTGTDVIWDKIVYGVSFNAICNGLRTKGCHFSRTQCMAILSFLPKMIVANQGYRELRSVAIPEPIIYFNVDGEKKFITTVAGESVTLSNDRTQFSGIGVTFDELPLYVLQNLSFQLIAGKFDAEHRTLTELSAQFNANHFTSAYVLASKAITELTEHATLPLATKNMLHTNQATFEEAEDSRIKFGKSYTWIAEYRDGEHYADLYFI